MVLTHFAITESLREVPLFKGDEMFVKCGIELIHDEVIIQADNSSAPCITIN